MKVHAHVRRHVFNAIAMISIVIPVNLALLPKSYDSLPNVDRPLTDCGSTVNRLSVDCWVFGKHNSSILYNSGEWPAYVYMINEVH